MQPFHHRMPQYYNKIAILQVPPGKSPCQHSEAAHLPYKALYKINLQTMNIPASYDIP
jgi:hypothetical protein